MNVDKISLIIIDDDFSSRNTIKSYIRTSKCYFVADDFSNAGSALEWLKNYRTDIAICDMNMPDVDGIEFITLALRFCPDLRFLAISAYSDFRYLRECMVHSVEDYLLKHELTAELLINTLDKIREKYNMIPYSALSPDTFHIIEQDAQFTVENIQNLADNKFINFNVETVIPVIISPDYNDDVFRNRIDFSNNVVFAIKDIITAVLDNKYLYIMHLNASFQFALLFSFDKNNEKRTEKETNAALQTKMKAICQLLKDKVLRLLNVTLTIAYSPFPMKLHEAADILPRARSFRETKLYSPSGILSILGKSEILFSGKYTLPAYMKEQIKTLLEIKDFLALKKLIHNVYAEFSENRLSVKKVIEISEKLYNYINSMLKADKATKKIDFSEFEFIGQFEKALINSIDNFNSEMNPVYSIPVIHALSYIANHYKEIISLESCAENVDISYAHLSRIFKKETSLSFSEYLNRFRVNKAKMFLAEKKLPIKQIVDETGFTNYNYFFKVFKGVEGITPVEYIEGANN
jgi:YesN/AraC family two-component response regulator